jgi:hypothetical protein
MADLSNLDAAQTIKIAGSDTSGNETEFVSSTSGSLNVNVTNSTGASAVNIQDGGNSITVDGSVTAHDISNTVTTGTISALNGTVTLSSIAGVQSVLVAVSGTWGLLLRFEGETTSGTWESIYGTSVGSPSNYAAVVVANGNYIFNVAGYQGFRAKCITYTSGTINITMNASPKLWSVSSSQAGYWEVAQRDSIRKTYSVAVAALNVANNPTDIFTITGGSGVTTKITKIAISGTQTTAANRDVLLIKRSAANTGGTSTTPTIAGHLSSNGAASSVVRAYTANPSSLGASLGTVRASKVLIGTTTSATTEIVWQFANTPGQAIQLIGTSEVLAINLNGVTSAGNSLNIYVEWIEET